MALTLPFINTLPAFDATKGTMTSVNVLGGDAITGYQFFIFENDGSDTPFYTSQIINIASDIETVDLRSFPITIPANASGNNIILRNNNSYRIQVRTFNETDSIYSNYTTFQCYKTPFINLMYWSNNAQYENLQSNAIIPNAIAELKVVFNPKDLNSSAKPNKVVVNLYGVQNGNEVYIGTTGDIYAFDYSLLDGEINYVSEFDLSGFSINVNIDSEGNISSKTDSMFSSFIIKYECTTIDGMSISATITDINCFYKTIQHSSFLNLQNMCQQGVIKITCDGLTTLVGESNPSFEDLSFIDGQELDLTQSGSWVQWQKYFSLQQPYTLRIWARNLQDGVIATLASTSVKGAYITIKKETKYEYYDNGLNDPFLVNKTFISLDSGLLNTYPYHIESNKILYNSEITEDTKFFIGIQCQGGLFDIDFQILN